MTDVSGYLRKMADDERRVDYGRALQESAAARNFGNIGHNLYAIANNMLRAGYKGALQHFTGQIPLTGERDAQGARGALDAVGAAGLAAGPLAGRALAQVAATPKPARGITAYHGSPHDFDKFQMSQIGTGEGAQAYGHGLYFAEEPAVARDYQRTLSLRHNPSTLPTDYTDPNVIMRYVSEHAGSVDAAKKMLDEGLQGKWIFGAKKKGMFGETAQHKAIREARRMLDEDGQLRDPWDYAGPQGGRLYEVNIKANKEDFLDWDRTIAEQPERVRAAVRKLTSTHSGDVGIREVVDADGSISYHVNTPNGALITHSKAIADDALQSYRRSPIDEKTDTGQVVARGRSEGIDAEIAKTLKDAGIPGIKYLDQGSRSPKPAQLSIDGKPIAEGTDVGDLISAELRAFQGDTQAALRSLEAKAVPEPGFNDPLAPARNEAIQLLRDGRVTWDRSGQTYNFVVFDEDLIEITKKMGIAVPIPGVPGVVVSEEDFNALQGMQDGAVR